MIKKQKLSKQELDEIISEIESDEGAEIENALGIASLYMEYNEINLAIERLERCNSIAESAEAHYTLGEIYEICSTTDLENAESFYYKAKDSYKRAHELATVGDLQTLIASAAGLARIENLSGNEVEAEHWRKAARDKFFTFSEMLEDLRLLVRGEQQFSVVRSGLCGECCTERRNRLGVYRFGRCVPCHSRLC